MERRVDRSKLSHRDHARELVDRYRPSVVLARCEDRRALVERKRVDLVETTTEDPLGGLVEEERVPSTIDDERGCR